MPSPPRRRWQVISVYLSVRAQCTQCRAPSTRSPVSSKPTTSAALSVTHVGQEPAEPPGGPLGHRRDGRLGQWGAEQLGQRGGGPLAGQELPDIQVYHDRGDPRPVLHGASTRPGRRRRCVARTRIPA